VVGCDREAEARKDATRQRLIGTWLREEEQDGIRLRRVVVLSADKSFKEAAKVTAKDGSVETESHSGEWFFDGINFKRKYTHLNDKPLSNSRMTYATFRLEQSSDDEIRGSDDVGNRKVIYRRVAPGTQP
jgi:hypothetical protein